MKNESGNKWGTILLWPKEPERGGTRGEADGKLIDPGVIDRFLRFRSRIRRRGGVIFFFIWLWDFFFGPLPSFSNIFFPFLIKKNPFISSIFITIIFTLKVQRYAHKSVDECKVTQQGRGNGVIGKVKFLEWVKLHYKICNILDFYH